MNLVLGENFMPAFASTGEKMLDLSFKLVRNFSKEEIHKYIEDVYNQLSERTVESSKFIETLVNLYVLAFSTRDCRGGKGEKLIFYHFLLKLYTIHPSSTIAMLHFIPHFGYYKDFFLILELVSNEQNILYKPLSMAIINLIGEQIKKDYENINLGREKISLLSKFMPREKSKFHVNNPRKFKNIIIKIHELIQPEINLTPNHNYRLIISRLTKVLDVTETKMCGKRYASIDFSSVPSICLKKNTSAFLNEKGTVNPNFSETGNRYPNDSDRIEARKNFIDNIKSDKKLNAGQLFPHQIVESIFSMRSDKVKALLYQKQWDSVKDNMNKQINDYLSSSDKKPLISFGNLVPLVDVSGSMSGTPMLVAISLGILIAEQSHEAFRNSFITFESHPSWVKFTENMSITEKVTITRNAPWGTSTNVLAAIDLIIEKIKKYNLKENEVPDIIIFSDMQFNQADSSSKKSGPIHKILKEKFRTLGISLNGKPYKPPRIIYWNLRSSIGFPAESDEENVLLLSGFSPALFKYLFLNGSKNEDDSKDNDNNKSNPLEGLEKILADPRYFNIRTEFSNKSLELFGSKEAYHFIPPLDEHTIEYENDKKMDLDYEIIS